MLFYVDCLTRLTISTTTFGSKYRHCCSVTFLYVDLEISYFAATIMDIAYGIEIQESGDRYISLAEEVNKAGTEAAIPGAFLVDLFPVLVYVPGWFPGAGFQKKAAQWRKLNESMVGKPFRYVQEQLVREPFS